MTCYVSVRQVVTYVLAVCAVMFIAAPGASADSEYLPRNNYGAMFEPPDGILHGAGQTYTDAAHDQAYENYCDVMGAGKYPVVFMDYCGVTTGSSFYSELRTRLESIRDDYGIWAIPQIGCTFTSSGQPTQTQINTFVNNLKNVLDWPCFLRLSYEFNGTWYNPMYNPTDFKASWIAITNALRANGVQAATVFCPYPGFYTGYYGSWDYISQFYPGDQYVDWFGSDVFSAGDFTNDYYSDDNSTPELVEVANAAHAHGKPLMIGEATPRYVGAQNASDWNAWFVKFFDFFKNNPSVKGHVYINWDWAGTRWPDWDDARLETADPYVRNNYLAEMDDPIWVHATEYMPGWAGADCGDWGFLAADMDKDCVVDWTDFSVFAAQWQMCNDPVDPSCTPNW